MLGQSSSPSANSTDPSTKIADQIKALQDAMAQQQKQIEMLQRQLAEQKEAKVVSATYTTTSPAAADAAVSDQEPGAKESPLSFRIGGADFTPGGFVDFENVFRTTNTGNAAATSYGAIPFSNNATGVGHLTEFRSTGQYSRFSMKVTDKFGANNVTGFIEADFNGNDANTVFQTTNPHTFRVRLYWLDLKRGKWEFLGGQAWGLLTPNRVGLSPNPSDLALTLGEDANVHVGVNHSRAGTFRAIWHPNDHVAWGVGIENSQQFIGNEVTFPRSFALPLGKQFDDGATPGAPNVAPDINTKIAYDTNPGGKHFHFEVGATTTVVKTTVIPTVPTATFTSHSKLGGGIQGALNVELLKGFRLLANGMYGNGVGRYMIALGPTAVVRPITESGGPTCTSTTNPGPPPIIVVTGNCGAQPSLVHAANGTVGFELQATPKTVFGAYYGGAYFQRNAFPDLTGGTAQPLIGFGGIGQALAPNQNRAIQEGTFDWTQTFWKNPQHGAVLLVAQESYVTRAPWFVAAGAPKNAHLFMSYLSLRYVLP